MREPLFVQTAREGGDEDWRKANMDVFFRGGLLDTTQAAAAAAGSGGGGCAESDLRPRL